MSSSALHRAHLWKKEKKKTIKTRTGIAVDALGVIKEYKREPLKLNVYFHVFISGTKHTSGQICSHADMLVNSNYSWRQLLLKSIQINLARTSENCRNKM